MGSVVSGATFAISNRGWNVPENNFKKLYTYQSVGIGTGKVDGTLNLKGSFVSPANLVTVPITDPTITLGTIAQSIINNYITIITIGVLTGQNNITLPLGVDGKYIKIFIPNNTITTNVNNTLNITGITPNIVLTSNTVTLKVIELYFNIHLGPAGQWILLNSS